MKPEEIIDFLEAYYGLDKGELKSRSRKPQIVHARHIGMYLVKKNHPELSLNEIGKCFDRDHTTVIAGINNINEFRSPGIFSEIKRIERDMGEVVSDEKTNGYTATISESRIHKMSIV